MAQSAVNATFLIARKERHLTQGQLAKRVGLTPNDVVRIERYHWMPPLAMRRRLARELKTAVETLFGEA